MHGINKDRNGNTGWFLLPIKDAQRIEFNINGALDPSLAAAFGSSPRRCNGTVRPEKMIRAVEPAREKSGFLGRSTCTRSKMDIGNVIAASRPAIRIEEKMTYEQLMKFDALRDPLVQRDNVRVWPTPYAYHRTLSLPLVWQSLNIRPDFLFSDLRRLASDLADTLNTEDGVGVRLQTQEWYPRHVTDTLSQHLSILRGDETIMLSGIRFMRFDFVILCAPDAHAACDAVDVSALLAHAERLRDADVLNAALEAQYPLSDNNIALHDALSETDLLRDSLIAPTSKERQFPVTWYDARASTQSK